VTRRLSATPTDWAGRPLGKTRTFSRRSGQADLEEVPEGSIAVVREWVGYDPERAKAALLREHAADKPRSGLVEALERIVKES
jgi:hypothetical protein